MSLHSVLINSKAEKNQYKSVVHSYPHQSIFDHIKQNEYCKVTGKIRLNTSKPSGLKTYGMLKFNRRGNHYVTGLL